MRLISVCVVCICSVLSLTSCTSNLGDYSVKKKTGPLSDEEIRTHFNALGLSCERFSIVMPKKGKVNITSERFENGSSICGGCTVAANLDAGVNDIVFCEARKENKSLISVHYAGGYAVFFTGDLQDRMARIWAPVPIEKLTTQKQPVCIFAANKNEIRSFPLYKRNFDVEEFVKNYELALVIYAELEEPSDTEGE